MSGNKFIYFNINHAIEAKLQDDLRPKVKDRLLKAGFKEVTTEGRIDQISKLVPSKDYTPTFPLQFEVKINKSDVILVVSSCHSKVTTRRFAFSYLELAEDWNTFMFLIEYFIAHSHENLDELEVYSHFENLIHPAIVDQ
jgi:hypothetical protein